jgi:hypothetical protein
VPVALVVVVAGGFEAAVDDVQRDAAGLDVEARSEGDADDAAEHLGGEDDAAARQHRPSVDAYVVGRSADRHVFDRAIDEGVGVVGPAGEVDQRAADDGVRDYAGVAGDARQHPAGGGGGNIAAGADLGVDHPAAPVEFKIATGADDDVLASGLG